MTNEEIAKAIMADIESRKGLGPIWNEYWQNVRPGTREAIIDAWSVLINEARRDPRFL